MTVLIFLSGIVAGAVGGHIAQLVACLRAPTEPTRTAPPATCRQIRRDRRRRRADVRLALDRGRDARRS